MRRKRRKEWKGKDRESPDARLIYTFIPHQTTSYLALVGLMREENFNKKGLIDYNIDCLKQSLQALYTPASRAASRAGGRDSASPDGVGAAGPSSSAESGDRSR